MKRQTLAASIVLLTFVSFAHGNITYNIVDYPVNQTDLNSQSYHQDHISGTLITDGTMGVYADKSPHFLGGSLTFSGPNGVYSVPLSPFFITASAPGFVASPTQLTLPTGSSAGFYGSDSSSLIEIWLAYSRDPSPMGTQYFGNDAFNGSNLDGFGLGVPVGGIAASDPWVLATVAPEPGTLALLCAALLAVGAVYLRQRVARA
jgi:hypothetical protein